MTRDVDMELFSSSYPFMPLWALSICLFIGLLIARETGKFLRDRHAPPKDGEESTFIVTSAIGLLSLLIAFTFSVALLRYEERRVLVVDEANAIASTWMRMGLLDAGDREHMENILRRYVDARIAFGQATSAREEEREYERTEALQAELWSALMAVVAPFRDSPRVVLLVHAADEAVGLAAERYAVRQAHIPSRILRMLFFFALLTAGMVGYEQGSRRRETTLLFVLLTLAATLVIDLDRPSTGLTNVPQQPMLDLKASLSVGASRSGPMLSAKPP